ncbi:fimbrial protein [Limnobaculum xujianqingii]|uniref:fimbrial protein n=1 Tax=Limnobaculum xujianqingii TaxID=2738837 RepID=UPI00112B1FB5|nr:fimbrial protein [Limnobaculum xujianqingii]
MRKTYIIKIVMLIFFSISGQSVWASCTFMSLYSANINLGSHVVQRDLPVGSIIATITDPGNPSQYIGYCASKSGGAYNLFSYPNSSLTGISNVYSTNIPGVGISISNSTGIYYSNPPSYSYNTTTYVYPYPRIIKIVKTGPITSGSFQLGLLGRSYLDGDGRDAMQYRITGGSVTQVACSITTPNVNVPLDSVLASSFTGVNSTKGDKPFTIGLNCDAGARINASLSFDQNTDTSNTSVIKLTGAGSAGIATGVGIQLLYGSTPLQRNTNIVLKTSTGGQEFPTGSFTARYFQTKSTVTTGDANATATLNLTYQ